ncbi:MAG: hypothetical protein M3R62_05705 [Acidobacteriota bacterium]|nr:hypothetical protein [Acidobacteriota bacterium]
MRGRRLDLALFGLALAAAPAAVAQQQPVYGCRSAISCRPSPIGNSALAGDSGSSMLVGASVRWGPGFHAGFVTSLLKIPPPEPPPWSNNFTFHLRGVSLLPTPQPAPEPGSPPPTPTPTAAPSREGRPNSGVYN